MAKTKRIHHSRAFWKDVVPEFLASGMSQAAFARDIKVNPTTLNNWIMKLRKESDDSEATPHFIEVVPSRAASFTAPAAPTATRIVVGGVALEFCDLPPVAYVAALLREVAA